MNDTASIPELLRTARTIAIVGLSAREDRPSHHIAIYLQTQGYRIIPVNPTYAGIHILGEHCYATLKLAAEAVTPETGPIDIVDCFRRPEHIAPIVDEAIALGAACIWMQEGIAHEAAAGKARAAGLAVVMDSCIKVAHRTWCGVGAGHGYDGHPP